MVMLRKAMGGGAEGPESPAEMEAQPEPMLVKCPKCGETFDANAPEAQVQDTEPVA